MRLGDYISAFLLACALSAPATWAQQQTGAGESQGKPVPPVAPQGAAEGAAEAANPASPAGAVSLSGPGEFTPGSVHASANYFLPSFQIFEMGDSNFEQRTGPQKFETVNTAVGRLAVQRAGKHSRITADYLGGATTFNHHSEFNATMHELGITQIYQGRRWTWLFDDRASYLPESSFGYGGFGWLGSLGSYLGGGMGSNLANQNPLYSSNQWLFSGRGSRIANTATAQVQLATGRHSAFSLGGSYGLLDFRSAGGIDSRNALFTAGYSRAITPRDTLGLSYGFNTLRFLHIGRSFRVHLLEMDYGHRITGKLAVQAGGGAQVSLFNNPFAGSDTSPSWIAHGAVNYNSTKNGFSLSYARYVTNGGGVLIGAYTQAVQFGWSRQLTRHLSGSLGPGFARNTNFAQTTASKGEYTYDSVYAMASLSRSLGRNTTMFLTYNWQNQRAQASACSTANCRTSLLRHLVTFGFDWHRRQLTGD